MSWTRTLKTTTHTFIFHKIALLTNQTNLGRSQQPISLSARCTIFPTNYNHGQKSWDTFAFLEAFSNSHRSNPSPHLTNKVGRVYPEFFVRFLTLHIGKGRENCKKISKTMQCFMTEPRNLLYKLQCFTRISTTEKCGI